MGGLVLERLARLAEVLLQRDDVLGGPQAQLEQVVFERAGDEVIGPAFQRNLRLAFAGPPADHDRVDVGRIGTIP